MNVLIQALLPGLDIASRTAGTDPRGSRNNPMGVNHPS